MGFFSLLRKSAKWLKWLWNRITGRPTAEAHDRGVAIGGATQGPVATGDQPTIITGPVTVTHTQLDKETMSDLVRLRDLTDRINTLETEQAKIKEQLEQRLMAQPAGELAARALGETTQTPRQGITSVRPASATVGLGQTISLPITLVPAPGITVGALTIDVIYDSSKLKAIECSAASGPCNKDFASNTVRFAQASTKGLSGPIGRVTFQAIAPGTAKLGIKIVTCANVFGQFVTCTGVGSTVTIQEL